jgi:predicted RNA-binding protein with TRAM domain
MKKKDIVEFKIESYAFEGKGIAKINQSELNHINNDTDKKYVMFVHNSYPGDVVKAQILKLKKSRHHLFAGIELTTVQQVEPFADKMWSGVRQFGIYLPVGYQLIGKKGFTLQVDIGPNFVNENWGQINTSPILGSIKLGITPKKSM